MIGNFLEYDNWHVYLFFLQDAHLICTKHLFFSPKKLLKKVHNLHFKIEDYILGLSKFGFQESFTNTYFREKKVHFRFFYMYINLNIIH